MHQRRAVVGGHVLRQPAHQCVHGRQRVGAGRDVLLAPTLDLARKVVAGLAVVAETRRRKIHAMQAGQYADHLAVDRGPLRSRQLRERGVPKHPSRHVVHQEELGADHTRVVTVQACLGHRHFAVRERADHAVLAIDHVRGGQQRAGRLLPQHVRALASLHLVGGVTLATRELLHLQGTRRIGQLPRRYVPSASASIGRL